MGCISKLRASTDKATDVLIALLESESEQVRRAAANDILSQTLKFEEVKEIEERMKEIERQLKYR